MKTTAEIKGVEVIVIYDITDKFRNTIELKSVKVDNGVIDFVEQLTDRMRNNLIKQIKSKS